MEQSLKNKDTNVKLPEVVTLFTWVWVKKVTVNWPFFGRAKGGIHGPATTEAHDILHELGILVMLNVITNVGTSRSAI